MSALRRNRRNAARARAALRACDAARPRRIGPFGRTGLLEYQWRGVEFALRRHAMGHRWTRPDARAGEYAAPPRDAVVDRSASRLAEHTARVVNDLRPAERELLERRLSAPPAPRYVPPPPTREHATVERVDRRPAPRRGLPLMAMLLAVAVGLGGDVGGGDR